MSALSLAAPLVLSAACALVPWVGRSHHPATRARVLAMLLGAAGLAAAGWTFVLGGAFLIDLGGIDPDVSPVTWLLAAHGYGPPFVGVLALANALVALLFVANTLRPVVSRSPRREGDLLILPREDPIAFVMPGRQPYVSVSAGMMRQLAPSELDVVLAHERSHIAHGHHRYLRGARVAVAFAPWLRWLVRTMELELERWADEDAAEAIGDRRLVARTITVVALAGAVPAEALGFARHHTVRRVRAMLDEPPRPPTTLDSVAAAGAGAAATGVAGSALQLHHALAVFH